MIKKRSKTGAKKTAFTVIKNVIKYTLILCIIMLVFEIIAKIAIFDICYQRCKGKDGRCHTKHEGICKKEFGEDNTFEEFWLYTYISNMRKSVTVLFVDEEIYERVIRNFYNVH